MTEHRSRIVAALNEIGTALTDTGVIGALHPHSGSCVQTRDDVYEVMEAVDTNVMKLAPDVGELLAGGADPLPILRDFPGVIRHVHLKDYNSGATHDGYCPLGEGRVNLAAAIDLLEQTSNDVMMMVELNPQPGGTGSAPLETARTSRKYLEKLGYSFTS